MCHIFALTDRVIVGALFFRNMGRHLPPHKVDTYNRCVQAVNKDLKYQWEDNFADFPDSRIVLCRHRGARQNGLQWLEKDGAHLNMHAKILQISLFVCLLNSLAFMPAVRLYALPGSRT